MRHKEKEFTERVREASDQNQEKTVKECKQKINNEFIEKVIVHEGEGMTAASG